MSSLLERRIAGLDRQLVVLAPSRATATRRLGSLHISPQDHRSLLRQAQRLRGSVYLRDGAITAGQLAADGALVTDDDDRSWHFLMLDTEHRVEACSWYLEHKNTATMHDLRVRRSALASHPDTHAWLQSAVEAELASARQAGIHYSEVGGWAVAEDRRCTTEALMLIFVTFAVSRLLGGALGLATATRRHSSSEILRRVGFEPLGRDGDAGSSYFDPQYNCDMELLRFDTRRLTPRYDALVDRLADRFHTTRVVAAAAARVIKRPLGERRREFAAA